MRSRRFAPQVRNILASRIGRRFVAVFACCALLPLLLFAWLAVGRTTAMMRAESVAALHDGAKSAGMGLAARLSRVVGDLSLARAFARAGAAGAPSLAALGEHALGRCESIWKVERGQVVGLCGAAPPPLRGLTESERALLAAGRTALRADPDDGSLTLVAALRERRPEDGLLAARVRREWFWDADEMRSGGAEVMVCDGSWRPLFATWPTPPTTRPFAFAALTEQASGTVEWAPDDEPHLARYWRAFLRPQYGCDLFVVQSKPQRDALAVSRQFAWWFACTAATTLLLALLASLVQIRRTLGPIMALGDATRRLAAGDLDARTGVRGRDEFGALGRAFDDMAAQLQENVRRREQTERDLVASRDAALAAVRAKEAFIDNVSHEFRTPMAAVLGATEILTRLEKGEVDALEEFSGIAHSGAQRLARLVDDVIELSGNEPWSASEVDVGATVAAAIAALPAAARARVRAHGLDGDGAARALGNADKLTDAWARLLDNALKFSPPDEPVEVRVDALAGAVVVAVTDRGPGIDAADVAQIFEPFRQVGRDIMTEKANGAGLGLTLVRRTIERHGGAIAVDTAPGAGATFRVRLPALVEKPAARV